MIRDMCSFFLWVENNDANTQDILSSSAVTHFKSGTRLLPGDIQNNHSTLKTLFTKFVLVQYEACFNNYFM